MIRYEDHINIYHLVSQLFTIKFFVCLVLYHFFFLLFYLGYISLKIVDYPSEIVKHIVGYQTVFFINQACTQKKSESIKTLSVGRRTK